MSLYQRLLGHPWVFEHIRPLAVGGVDMSPAYGRLNCGPHSVILDVGCGTGDALTHIEEYGEYLGLDTDPVAIEYARTRHAGRPRARFECRTTRPDDFSKFAPTHVVMVGLLHHLSDNEAVELLTMLADSKRLERAVTLDIVYLRGHFYNNLMAWLDRGRYCRTPALYLELARRARLNVVNHLTVRSHPTRGLVKYFILELRPASRGG